MGRTRTIGAAPAALPNRTATTINDRARPAGIAMLGTSLWEAAFDQDEAILSGSGATESAVGSGSRDDHEDGRGGGGDLFCVTVDKGSKLGIRVRDDHPLLPGTCCITQFDPCPATGKPGPIEASGVVAIGDSLVRVDDVNVEGKGVREALTLIRGAADDAVILTFRRLERGQLEEAAAAAPAAPSQVTEQHRALILRHLLFESGPRIPEDRVRFLAAQGIPDCDKSLRPLIWRILLQLLGYDRDGWDAPLRDQRQIYAQFVADLCVLPEQDEGEEQQPAQQLGQYQREGKEEEKESAAGALVVVDCTSADPEPLTPKTKKQLLVPSSCPPSSAISFDLDASASFAALASIPGSRVALSASSDDARSRSASTSTSRGDGLGASVLGASAAGSQPHFAYARPKTRVRFQGDRALFDEIKRDVVRTYPDQAWFLDIAHGGRRYGALQRLLFIYAKVNPGVRYVQGMNELMATVFFVLAAGDPDPAWSAHAEADAFFCFTNLMSQLRDLFQVGLDAADSGIEGRIGELVALLARHDPQLNAHFDAIGLHPHFFVLRWLTTLFSREFLLPDTVRVWDSMLAEPPASLFEFVTYFALSMIMEQREALLGNDFSHCLRLLQSYPSTADTQSLLRRAAALREHDAAARQRGSDTGAAAGDGGGAGKLRRVLARMASTVEGIRAPAGLDSLSADSRRTGAQIRSSFLIVSKKLMENLAVLDDSVGEDRGKGKGKELQPAQRHLRRPPPPAAGLSSSSDEDEDGREEDGFGRGKSSR